MKPQRLRPVLIGLALAGVALLAACTPPPPPPPPPPPSPPPMPPAISLSTAVIQDAVVFQRYIDRTSAISPAFKGPDDVSGALGQASTISSEQLLRGEIAYAAIAALQDPPFVASVRAFAGDPQARQQMTARILDDPDYAVALGGSDTAAALAATALLPQGRRLFDAGTAVKQAAYDIQSQSWSNEPVADRPGRLANAKNGGLSAGTASMDEIAALRAAAIGQTPMPLRRPDIAAAPPYPPVIVRGLAIAALAALGEGGDDNLVSLAPIMTDAPTATCLTTAKLNLYQCLAVARPNYEDIFCLGQHAMMDPGQCLMIAAGAPAPAFNPPAALPPTPAPAAKPTTKPTRRHRHH